MATDIIVFIEVIQIHTLSSDKSSMYHKLLYWEEYDRRIVFFLRVMLNRKSAFRYWRTVLHHNFENIQPFEQ